MRGKSDTKVVINTSEITDLKVPVRSGNADGRLIAHHLRGDHCQSFALRRVDLARHDTTSRLILWKSEFTKSTSRARTKEADVVCYLHERNCNYIQSTVGFYQGIMGCERFKLPIMIISKYLKQNQKAFNLVRCSLELVPSQVGNLSSYLDVEAFLGI